MKFWLPLGIILGVVIFSTVRICKLEVPTNYAKTGNWLEVGLSNDKLDTPKERLKHMKSLIPWKYKRFILKWGLTLIFVIWLYKKMYGRKEEEK